MMWSIIFKYMALGMGLSSLVALISYPIVIYKELFSKI